MISTSLITQFGDSSSVFSALGISVQAFLIQLITFLIAFFVLRKWAFKPILKILDERRQRIEDGLTLGERMEDEKSKLDEAVARELRNARLEADKILSTAETEAKQTVQAAEDTARKRAEQVLEDADAQIKQLSQRERSRLEKELIGLVSEVSEAVIHEKVDGPKDQELINAALKGRKTA